jgi:hypothetical protein
MTPPIACALGFVAACVLVTPWIAKLRGELASAREWTAYLEWDRARLREARDRAFEALFASRRRER